MKFPLLLGALTLLAVPLFAADATPKDEVAAAAKALADQPNYTWRTTVEVPPDAQFRPGPTDGKTEKDGFTQLTVSFGGNETKIFTKGDKAALTNQDGDWQSAAELENEQGPGRFMAMMARGVQVPAEQAKELAGQAKELKRDGDVIAGELTEEGAKGLMRFRRRGAGGDGPAISGAKGSVKFWLKDGALTKYEFKVTGTMEFNGNEFDVDRKTTVEIKDVGTTKVEVPEAAKKKLT